MKTKVSIPTTEKRSKTLTIKISQTEHNTIKVFCTNNKTTLTGFVRFALNSILPDIKN